jgi:hypothetical protein
MFEQNASWEELIKKIRAMRETDIFTAQKIALLHDGWRRRCEYMINHDQRCRKQATHHIKDHGRHSLVAMAARRFVITSGLD